MRRRPFLPPLMVAVGVAVIAPVSPALAAPATGELVSRADGVDGAPIPFTNVGSATASYVSFNDGVTEWVRNRNTGETSPGGPYVEPPPLTSAYGTVPPDGGVILSHTASGRTITYRRALPDGGTMVGLLTYGQTPVVIARSDTHASDAACPTSAASTRRTSPVSLLISSDGKRLWLQTSNRETGPTVMRQYDTFSTRSPQATDGVFTPTTLTVDQSTHPVIFKMLDIGKTGSWMLSAQHGLNNDPARLTITAAAGSAASNAGPLPELPTTRDGNPIETTSARFFGEADGGIVRGEVERPFTGRIAQNSGVWAYDALTPQNPSYEVQPKAALTDIPDTPAIASTTTVDPCPVDPQPAPVGTAAQYEPITLAPNLSSKASAGTVNVTLAPSGVRAASKVQVAVKFMGITLWQQTATTSGPVALPNPYRWVPEKVTTFATIPAAGAEPATVVSGSKQFLSWR